MDYFYKRFNSYLSIRKFTWCDATIFPGLDKDANDIKGARQHMDVMCFIETAYPPRSFCLWNELENDNILGKSTNVHPKTIYKAYYVICKYKTP